MSKRKAITIITISAILILFIPFPVPNVYKDGGTQTYSALTYKVVKWNRIFDVNYQYSKTSVYWLPDNFKSLDELWTLEQSRQDK